MPDPTQHNYMKKLLSLFLAGELLPGSVHINDIAHDEWCAIFQGGYCNCDPDIYIRNISFPDPERN
jgi:hypothetical protein